MVEGIPPGEASERLSIFQSRFDGLFRKFVTYSTGEDLFGLEITDYPQLHVVKKELGLLQKLYGLYNAVMDSIDGYYELPWTEVDTDAINTQLLDFQNRCRKLPKARVHTFSTSVIGFNKHFFFSFFFFQLIFFCSVSP